MAGVKMESGSSDDARRDLKSGVASSGENKLATATGETKEERRARKKAKKLAVEADPTHPIPEHPIPEPSSAAAERALAQALEASPKTEQIPAKKSKSKRKIVEPGAVNSDASAVGTINGEQLDTEKVVKQEQVKKSKKRKSKEENGDAPLVSVDGLREAEDRKKDKKGKTRIAGTEAEGEDGNVSANGVGNGDGKKHKKAKKEKSRIDGLGKVTSNGALAPTLGDGIEGNEVEKPSKKVKKEKRKRYDEPETSANGASSCKNVVEAAHGDQVDPAKKPKKSKKIKSDVDCNGDDVAPSNSLEDILADPELSDQAKKALQYVHQHATSHLQSSAVGPCEGWKFSKARQGWLMRHIWNEEVPEEYAEIVMGYLKTVEGGARSGLIETAKKHARTEQHSASETAPTDTPAATDGEAVANAEEIGQVEVEGLHAKTDLEKVEIRRARAERMLKIIGAR